MLWRFGALMRGPTGQELLDSPLSNFDVIGVPTTAWSSGLCDCFSNVIPSCVLSFSCPCIMWAQIVVRAQIPLLIGLKNSFQFLRANSGYGAFVEYFMWSLLLCIGLIIVLAVVNDQLPSMVTILLAIIIIVVGGTLLYLVAHTRKAFREKYQLPSNIPCKGASFWDNLMDVVIMTACFPCGLAQMARHVFQYDKMDTDVGLYMSDPSALPPLRPTEEQASGAQQGAFERPAIADEAGLQRHRGPHPNSGAAHRQQAIERRQREEMLRDSATPTTATVGPSAPGAPARGGVVMAEAVVLR